MMTAIAPYPVKPNPDVYTIEGFMDDQQAQFEVEDILNEIGILDDDYMTLIEHNDEYYKVQATAPSTAQEPFVPVSPDRKDEHSVASSSEGTLDCAYRSSVLTSSASVESLTTFSVPNPFALAVVTPQTKPKRAKVPLSKSNSDATPVDSLKKAPARAPKKKATREPKKVSTVERRKKVSTLQPKTKLPTVPLEPKTKLNPVPVEPKTTVSTEQPLKVTTEESKKKVVSKSATTPKSSPKESANSRKRKSPPVSCDSKELTEEQMQERRQRNREHAKKSRQRKKSLTVTLQQSAAEVKAENNKLRERLFSVIGQEKAEALLGERLRRASEHFILGLKTPSNRIVDNSTLDFLRSLREELPSTNEL